MNPKGHKKDQNRTYPTYITVSKNGIFSNPNKSIKLKKQFITYAIIAYVINIQNQIISSTIPK